MKRILFVASLVASFLIQAAGAVEAKDLPKTSPAKGPTVQIALLLDTSNSMDGLIEQAKSQLWSVVNEFIRVKPQDGRRPSIEVALYEYGNDNLPPQEGFVRLILPMTDDLDAVSEKLFALKTRGGQEYCGQVIRDAVSQLNWSRSGGVYKAIFIAGNEPFSQGPVEYQKSCRSAIEKGIIVNTIFCGPSAEGEQTGWRDGAVLADGRYMSIDQDHKVVAIPTPQDAEIARLGGEVNKTYLPYGKMGRTNLARQAAQDSNASAASFNAAVTRSISKGCPDVYCNDAWDLVDAIKNGKCKLDDLKDDELPDDFRKLSKAERRARVGDMGAEREKIQKRILTLNKERETFLAAERKKHVDQGKETLDSAILKAVREQAARANIRFE
jgi:von Willebrand factor type A domain